MTPQIIGRSVVACAAAIALTACEQSVSPVQPSTVTASTPSSGLPTSLISPHQATAIANAIGNCRGPVIFVLKTVFGSGTLVSVNDNGSTFSFELSSAGHTSSHEIDYVDEDGSEDLSCGDTVTAVDDIAP